MSALSGMTATSGQIQADYLNLLVTQLQNQNPLEPLDSNDMASQLAQLSELDQLETMNGTFQGVLAATRRTEAASLIGREVTFFPTGESEAVSERVDSVDISTGEIRLMAGRHVVALEDIQSIQG
jgi:flagellar basal-body rod modification protein FlgD